MEVWSKTLERVLRYLDPRLPFKPERERPASKLTQPRVTSKELPVTNSVVLIKENATSHNNWKLGCIIQLNVSRDQEVRSPRVWIGNGRIIVRPLSLLYPFECPEVPQVTNPTPPGRDEMAKHEATTTVRPKPEAASAARSHFHQLLNDGRL